MVFSAFLLGLLSSWHCIGMCGPIALMVPGAKGKNRIFSILLYHAGKITAYVVIGTLIGLVSVFITSFKVQAIITFSVGLLILIIAFLPSLLTYLERKGNTFFLPVIRIKNQLAKALNKNRLEYTFYIGFLNGFIPCGMVYMAALGAIAQPTLLEGMLFMALFGIGTMPFMSLLIFTKDFVQTHIRRFLVPARIIAFSAIGCFMIWKGVNNYNTALHPPRLGENYMICK